MKNFLMDNDLHKFVASTLGLIINYSGGDPLEVLQLIKYMEFQCVLTICDEYEDFLSLINSNAFLNKHCPITKEQYAEMKTLCIIKKIKKNDEL